MLLDSMWTLLSHIILIQQRFHRLIFMALSNQQNPFNCTTVGVDPSVIGKAPCAYLVQFDSSCIHEFIWTVITISCSIVYT